MSTDLDIDKVSPPASQEMRQGVLVVSHSPGRPQLAGRSTAALGAEAYAEAEDDWERNGQSASQEADDSPSNSQTQAQIAAVVADLRSALAPETEQAESEEFLPPQPKGRRPPLATVTNRHAAAGASAVRSTRAPRPPRPADSVLTAEQDTGGSGRASAGPRSSHSAPDRPAEEMAAVPLNRFNSLNDRALSGFTRLARTRSGSFQNPQAGSNLALVRRPSARQIGQLLEEYSADAAGAGGSGGGANSTSTSSGDSGIEASVVGGRAAAVTAAGYASVPFGSALPADAEYGPLSQPLRRSLPDIFNDEEVPLSLLMDEPILSPTNLLVSPPAGVTSQHDQSVASALVGHDLQAMSQAIVNEDSCAPASAAVLSETGSKRKASSRAASAALRPPPKGRRKRQSDSAAAVAPAAASPTNARIAGAEGGVVTKRGRSQTARGRKNGKPPASPVRSAVAGSPGLSTRPARQRRGASAQSRIADSPRPAGAVPSYAERVLDDAAELKWFDSEEEVEESEDDDDGSFREWEGELLANNDERAQMRPQIPFGELNLQADVEQTEIVQFAPTTTSTFSLSAYLQFLARRRGGQTVREALNVPIAPPHQLQLEDPRPLLLHYIVP